MIISIHKISDLCIDLTGNTSYPLWLCCSGICLYRPNRWHHRKCPLLFIFVRVLVLDASNVDKRSGSSKHHEVPAEISTANAIWFTDFLVSVLKISRTLTIFALFVDIDRVHYAGHRQNSRVLHGSLYASHKSETFILLCHNTLSTTWLLSPLVISKARHKIWYLYVLKRQTFLIAMRFHAQ